MYCPLGLCENLAAHLAGGRDLPKKEGIAC